MIIPVSLVITVVVVYVLCFLDKDFEPFLPISFIFGLIVLAVGLSVLLAVDIFLPPEEREITEEKVDIVEIIAESDDNQVADIYYLDNEGRNKEIESNNIINVDSEEEERIVTTKHYYKNKHVEYLFNTRFLEHKIYVNKEGLEDRQ